MRFSLKVICIVFVILFATINVCAAEKRETKNVLILAGHYKNMPGVKLAEKGIEQVFQANIEYRIKVDIEYLDLYRFTSKHYKQEIVDLLRYKYGDRQIDVVITILTSALRFMLDYGDKIFPDMPTVFTVVSEPTLTGLNLPSNVTGISYELDIKGTLETALKLQPNTKHVVLVACVSKTIGNMGKKAKKIFQSHKGDLQFTYLTDHSMDQILEQVARMPEDTILFNLGMYRDKAGNVFVPREAMAKIAGKSSVPSYGVFETFLGHGIVGGRLAGYEVQGRKAAQYALAILKGKKPSDLPVTSYETIVPMFDWRQLQRWGLDEERLPDGSIVRFKKLTTWGVYKWYIIGGISLFIIETILIFLLLFNWARRLKAESVLRKSHKELEFRVEERTADLAKTNEQLKEEIEEHKHAEEALRESETRFRAQYQGNPTATFTWQKSGEGFVLANFNNAAEAITHGRAHEYLGKTATELYGNRQEVQEVLHRCLAEKIVIRKDMVSHDFLPGRYIMTNYAFVPPDLVMVHVTDITERKHTEETMRKSEEKYRSLVESTEDSIYLLDKDGTYLFMNEKHLSRLGLPADKVIGKTYGEFHPLGDTKEFLEKIEKIFETGQTTQHEHRSFRDDRYFLRTLSPVKDPGGNTTSVTVVSKDITDRARSEEALKESEEKYRTVLEANPDPLVVYGMEGRVIYLNPAFTRVFHWSLEELIGKKMDNFVPEENWPETRMMISKVTVSGEDFSGFETRRYTRDGNTLDVSISGSFYRDREGNVAASVINLRDITEQKKMATQLQQSQKMEAVGTLAGGIAHDFNNILAVILGNAELAIDDVPKGNLVAECLEEIRLASIRAKEMIQQLLSFSRKTDEENKPLNMVPVIKASMKMLRTAIPSSVEFNQHISDEPCNIMGNASQINQIVMNLVTNAFHAMYEEEGLLEVTLEKIILQEEKPCFDWILAPGAYVRLKARDTGKGIDQQILGRIFEPYYTTKDVGKGTGMGLSVVHGIVKRHDGGIRVESEFGKGTVFEIYFPALVEMIEEEKELDGEIKGGSERILFVDDEASIVKLNHQRLESLGYRVKSTTRPLEALEWFRADPDQFDVIITDMTMPKMVGDKLTKEILAIRPDMPVIICTGYSERISADNAEALGARKYIEKPIEIRELAASLREVLEEK